MDKTFQVIEEDAVDSPVKDIQWQGQEVGTDSVPLVNSDIGKKIFIRQFEFNLPPGIEKPPEDELLRFHKSKVLAFLWKDELVSAGIMKVVFDPKDKNKFYIFALAEAKSGSVILESPQLLQNIHA